MDKARSKSVSTRLAILTILLGVLFTCFFAYQIQFNNEKRIISVVNEASNKVLEEVVARIQMYQYGLRGARAVVLTAGEYDISREIFHQYGLTRDFEVEFPGSRGFGFIRRVPQNQIDSTLQSIRQRDWPDYQIKEFSPNFAERYLVQFVEPYRDNLDAAAIGLDIASEKNRREAANEALYTGEVRITAPVVFPRNVGAVRQSVLILMPIYRGGKTPETLFEREKLGFGWSFAGLSMEDVLGKLDFDVTKVHYELFDTTDFDDKVRFYSSGDLNDRQYQQVQSVDLYGRHWESRFSVTADFISNLHLHNPYEVLLVGVFLSCISAAFLVIVRVNIARKREVMTYQSRIAAVVESSADGIISKNLEGVIVSWNKGAEDIFGYTKREVIGKSILDLLVPTDFQSEYQFALTSVRDNKSSLLIETYRKTKFGSNIPVSLTLSPIFDVDRRVNGISESVRDISERKKTEAKIRDLNASLESQVKTRTLELEELNLLLNDVLEASSEISIIATDTKGIIQVFNRGAQRMLGYSVEEVIGQLTPIVFHLEEEIQARREFILETSSIEVLSDIEVIIFTIKSEDYEGKEWTYIDKYGKTRPVSLVVTEMKNHANETVGFLSMAMDITEQKNNQQALEFARDQLLIATEAACLGVWCWNKGSDGLAWNDIMFDIYQYPLRFRDQGITLDHWLNRLHPEEKEAAFDVWSTTMEGEEYSDTFRIILPDSRIRYIKSDAYIERDEYGNTFRVTGVDRDVTAEYELEVGLRQAKDQADAASASKSNFLANMSHEIRTPMNAILGMLHLAKRTELTYQQNDYISKAQISAESLLGLINDILDFSKVDAGKLKLESIPFEIESLLYELSTVLSGSSLGKDVELIFDVDANIPVSLVGDKLRLLQILINLVSNAVKFTLEGYVVLAIKAAPSLKPSWCRLNISVQDTGIGIAKDQLESIFEVFSQAESSTARRFGGSGLGLVICRRFVELMGGELCIESELSEGSRFYFTVDLPIAEPPIQEAPIVGEGNRSIRLLAADCHPASQAILDQMALNLGWFCQKAGNIQQIITLVNEESRQGRSFDVILLDIKITDFNGRNSLEKMQASFDSSVVSPKIILLANVLNDKIYQTLESVSDYLLKPLTLNRLSEMVYKVLSKDLHLLDKKSPPVQSKVRLTGIKLLLVEDNMFNQQVATELLVAEGAIVTVTSGGAEGVKAVMESEDDAFDLVLMDMQMPDVDGLEATKLIRQDARFISLPIIAMTANVSEVDCQHCFQAGMNDHIGKPLNIDQMVACILQHIRPAENPDSGFNNIDDNDMRAIENGEHVFENGEGIQSIINRFGGSPDLFKSVVDSFLADSKGLLEVIAQSAKVRNKVKTYESIHTLKGASLTVGLLEFSKRLNSVELLLKTSEDSEQIESCLSMINATELDEFLQAELKTILNNLNDSSI